MTTYSILNYTGDGANITFAIDFPLGFESRSQVTCRVGTEGSDRTINWINDGLVTIGGAIPGDGVPVVFRRTQDTSLPKVDFEDGATITEENLDAANLQVLRALHEVQDGRFQNGINEDLNLKGFKVTNVAPGISDGDLATLGQLDDLRTQVLEAVDGATLDGFIQDAEDAAAEAATSASEAATSATDADNSATAAADSETAAAASASAASTSATNAATSATTAGTSASSAASSASTATTQATNAATSATNAATSASAAATSAANAATYADITQSNATGTSTDSGAATAAAAAAAASETAAAASASAASTSETNAANSASTANSAAGSASASASSATTSANNAATSATLAQTNATVYQTAAEAAATAAEGFKDGAEAAQTAAEAAQAAAEAAAASLDIDTDGTLAANSDLKVASQKATKTYVDTAIAGLGLQTASGSFTKNLADSTGGVNTIDSLAFRPKFILFFAATATTAAGSLGFAEDTGPGQHVTWQNSSGVVGNLTTVGIAQVVTVGSNQHIATIAITADGFTATWAKTGSPSGTTTVSWLAFG